MANLGSSITGIGERAFYGCSSLTSVAIPLTVKLIDDSAFQNCYDITGYQIPDSVTGVKDTVFVNNNSLTEIRFGTGLYSVGGQVARGVNTLTGLYFAQSGTHGGISRIGTRAFELCTGLESIRIPSGITNLGDSCFKDCQNLEVIRIMSENPPTFDSTLAPFASTDSNAKIYVKLADSANWASTFAGLDVEPIIVQDTFQLTLSEAPSTTDTFAFTFNQIASGSLGYKWESDESSPSASNNYTCEKAAAAVDGTTANTWRIQQSSYLNPIYFVDPRSSSANADTPFDVGSDWIRGQNDGAGNITILASGFSLNFQNVAYSDSLATGILTN
jgi:hypothetical protein